MLYKISKLFADYSVLQTFFLLLLNNIGIEERLFVTQSSANLSKKSILKQKFVICKLGNDNLAIATKKIPQHDVAV